MTTTTTQKKTAPKLSADVQKELDGMDTTAAKIRFLDSKKMSKGDISRALNIRYQWVRNVLNTPLKKAAA
jgi:hypothetical protein